ncbi:hypothetical protein [Pigmentiphaga litoralis]|uniref:DUF1795 domain-containing protein n=1 Tax=Pigmentiphaga litoralis TaxID=516702 RepID=A0A7Y9IPX7_9BURK|nr:hypothetical protein [Pigmentiphaga litoralis]NYE25488.1 hypothetical protein [Pigmentiphaga litoralis]NYE80900.1 hypothetical protein [Pigmentiphaga litoralis]
MRILPRLLVSLSLALSFVALTACSPKYDWREMPAADSAVKVTYPARPQSDTRDVNVAGYTLPLTFTIAQVDASVFAVGHAKLPDAVLNDPAEMAKVADAFEEVLRANLRGTLRQRREVTLKQSAADTRKLFRAVEVEVHGAVANSPSWLLGRVYVLGNSLIEIVALGPEAELTPDVARQFVESVKAE